MITITFSSRKKLPVITGFSTRSDFGELGRLPEPDEVEKNWTEEEVYAARKMIAAQIGHDGDIAHLNQVHGTTVHYVDTNGLHPEDGDGLWTDKPGVLLSVQTADCIPLLRYLNHPEKPAVGVIHVGWKGAHAGIVPQAIKQREEAGYDVARMYAWMGPSICQSNYEFGEEAMELFGDDYCSMAMDKTYLDLRGYIIDQLRDIGLLSTHIRYHAACTYDDDNFFSHRRNPTSNKRMFGMIGLTEKKKA